MNRVVLVGVMPSPANLLQIAGDCLRGGHTPASIVSPECGDPSITAAVAAAMTRRAGAGIPRQKNRDGAL